MSGSALAMGRRSSGIEACGQTLGSTNLGEASPFFFSKESDS